MKLTTTQKIIIAVIIVIIIAIVLYFVFRKKKVETTTTLNKEVAQNVASNVLDKIGDVATFDTLKYPINDPNFNFKVLAEKGYVPLGTEIFARNPANNWYLGYDPKQNKFVIFGTKDLPDLQLVNKSDAAMIDYIKKFTQYYGGRTWNDINYKLILT